MVHVEFVVLLLLLLWIQHQVGRCADARYLAERLDKIEQHQTHIIDVLRCGWAETIGAEKADAILWAADNPPWKKERQVGWRGENPDGKA